MYEWQKKETNSYLTLDVNGLQIFESFRSTLRR